MKQIEKRSTRSGPVKQVFLQYKSPTAQYRVIFVIDSCVTSFPLEQLDNKKMPSNASVSYLSVDILLFAVRKDRPIKRNERHVLATKNF